MRVLIVDNYDSFTFNLYQLVGELGGAPLVVRNDAVDLDQVRAISPERIILSPGPGHPGEPRRVGLCTQIVESVGHHVPILGVCLGHQLIMQVFGGHIVRARRPMHGMASEVHRLGEGLLSGLPEKFEAMRYHSLVADPERIPDVLRVTARTAEGEIMAIEHRSHPIYGLQFHPESIGTDLGREVVRAFLFGLDEGAKSASRCEPVYTPSVLRAE